MKTARKAVLSIFTLCVILISSFANPGAAYAVDANDNLASAKIVAALPYQDTQNTVGATAEAGEVVPHSLGCGSAFDNTSVWYSFTVPADGTYIFDTIGSDFDTVLSLWTGAAHPLTPVPGACNDDAVGAQSLIQIALTAGTTIYARASGYNTGQTGNLVFNVGTRPPHDDLANALVVGAPLYTNNQRNVGATLEPGEALGTCGGTQTASVWYSFTAPYTDNFTFDTLGSTLDTVMSIWTGAAHPLTQVACNDDGGPGYGNASFIQTNITSGTTVYIRISGYDAQIGDYTLTVDNTNSDPTISDILDQNTNEDTATGVIAFTVGDAETAPGSLIVTATSSNQVLVPDANITLGGTGANRTIDILPALNQFGASTITVSVSDGIDSASDTFVLTVDPVNDQPTTTGIADVNEFVDAADTVIDLWPSFADVEDTDGQLIYTVTGNTNAGLFTSVTVTGAPNQNLVLDYAPATTGTADITVRATDTGGLFVETTFTVTVVLFNNPPTGGDGAVTTAEDTLYTFTVADFTTATVPAYNDPDGDPFAGIEVTSLETEGTLQCGGVDVAVNDLCADVTTLTFLPGLNATGSPYATFGFKVCDALDCSAGNYTMTIDVTPVNDPPSVANLNNDAINYSENDPATLLDVGSDADVTDIDSADFNTGSLTIQFNLNGTADDRLAIQDACGVAPNDISLVGSNVFTNAGATLLGSFTGGVGTTPLVVTFGANATPATVDYLLRCISYENVSNTPSTLQRAVRFNVSDGDGGTSASDYAYVNFTGVNDAPLAVGETYATDMDTPLVVAAPGVLANDTDPDGDPLAAVKDSDPANGTLTLNADGSFTYTPNALFVGIDSFTYHANDGALASNVVTVNIGVEAVGTKLCGSGIFIDKGWEFIFPAGSIPGCIYINADDADTSEPYSGSLESLDHRIQVFAYANGLPVTKLNLPYEVCYTPNAEDYKKIGGNFALLRIGVFSNGGSSWELLPATEKKGKACASLNHFSYFDLFQVALPATGFAPDVVTPLPEQEVAYAPLGDLWLEIPRLGVQQAIVGVPLNENGWDVTWLGDQIGYLYGTAYPTGSGNSVLTAHVYDYNGKPGTFAGLKGLWWGDQVIVHAFGQEYVYEVRQVLQTGWESAASVLKHEERPWITLVTCKDYDEATNSYRARVVVRAVLVDVK